MPYQIQLHVDKEYEIKKNNWFYSLYYDIKSLLIRHRDNKHMQIIGTYNTEPESIYETFHYLVTHKYGGLCFDQFVINVQSGMYNSKEEIFLDQLYLDYDDNNKDIDEDSYFNLKFIEFLTNQTNTIEDINHTCLIYCNNSYSNDWVLTFECTE